MKIAFWQLCVTVCVRFVLDAGGVADYVDRIRGKHTAKWGVQLSEMAPDLIIEVVSPDSKRMDYLYQKIVVTVQNGWKIKCGQTPPKACCPHLKFPYFYKFAVSLFFILPNILASIHTAATESTNSAVNCAYASPYRGNRKFST